MPGDDVTPFPILDQTVLDPLRRLGTSQLTDWGELELPVSWPGEQEVGLIWQVRGESFFPDKELARLAEAGMAVPHRGVGQSQGTLFDFSEISSEVS